jgi:hypothetical protein
MYTAFPKSQTGIKKKSAFSVLALGWRGEEQANGMEKASLNRRRTSSITAGSRDGELYHSAGLPFTTSKIIP